jgi:glycosyltransferase involved in cell wall biosynthesis
VRIALLTEGGYPYARGEAVVWCDRLLRGLGGHEFEVYALSRSARQESGRRCELPGNVRRVRTAPLWDAPARRGSADARGGAAGSYGRRDRRRFEECFGELAAAVCGGGSGAGSWSAGAGPGARTGTEGQGAGAGAGEGGPDAEQLADRFAAGLYGLAELARDCGGGLRAMLRSELAVRILQSACRAPGTPRAVHSAKVTDLLAVSQRLERALRPLSLDWYGGGDGGGVGSASTSASGAASGSASGSASGLERVDLCHAVGGGPAALPGLLAKRFFGTPLLITEYGVRVREHYLASAADAVAPAAVAAVPPAAAGATVRALLASFQRQLAREAYTRAQLITPGNAHARRWQERCGAPRAKLRTVYPGMDAAPFAELGESAGRGAPAAGAEERRGACDATLVWAGRIEPAKDLIGLLHAFAEVRRAVPGARLRIVATAPGRGGEADEYEARCRALAAQLFPDEAADAVAVGENPVSFEELGSPSVPASVDAYGAASVVVLSSSVEGFPVQLVEAMFCGRATVSTDVGAVCEVIGGTGLVVPARNPRALADSCVALLRDPERRERLGAAARARALELFTVEQNVAAFRAIYLELMSRWPVAAAGGSVAVGEGEEPQPFGRPAEAHVPGRWADASLVLSGAPGAMAPLCAANGGRADREGGVR